MDANLINLTWPGSPIISARNYGQRTVLGALPKDKLHVPSARLPGALTLMPQELKQLSREQCEQRLKQEAHGHISRFQQLLERG